MADPECFDPDPTFHADPDPNILLARERKKFVYQIFNFFCKISSDLSSLGSNYKLSKLDKNSSKNKEMAFKKKKLQKN